MGRTGGRGNGGFLQTILSSVVTGRASFNQLAAIYRARWAVGIQFRAWKQALNLGKLVLTGMIAHQLGMNIARRIGNLLGRPRLSYE